jgi:hypothetical protein
VTDDASEAEGAELVLREALGDDLIERLARASREHNVMIAITVNPLNDEGDE